MKISLPFIIFLLCSSSGAWAKYGRAVRVDWKKIPGAVRYDVEWFDGKDCKSKAGSQTVGAPLWKHRLEAGLYCLRVRGVGRGDRPGEWTPMQKLPVKPKAPSSIAQTGNVVEWDKVPKSEQYQVEVVDQAGKVVHRVKVRNPEYRIPKKFQNVDANYKINVRSEVSGLPPSVARSHKMGTGGAMPVKQGAVDVAKILGAPTDRPDLPPQPIAEPIEIEEAEERFSLEGEVPIAPSLNDWKFAKTKMQKAVLRKRSIASSRVKLVEKVSRMHASDLRVNTGIGIGGYHYFGGGIFDDPLEDTSGLAVRYFVDIEYNKERPWGLVFQFRQLAIERFGISSPFTEFRILAEKHVPLDTLWTTFWTIGIGGEYGQHPLIGQGNEGSGSTFQSAVPVIAMGMNIRLGYHWKVNTKWTWETDGLVRIVPEQSLFDAFADAKFSGQGFEVSSAVTHRFTRQFEMNAGITANYSRIENEQSSIVSRVSSQVLFVRGTYRMSPSEVRSPAALTIAKRDQGRPWEMRLNAPLSFRNLNLVSHESRPESTDLVFPGVEGQLKFRFSKTSHWSLMFLGGFSPYKMEGRSVNASKVFLMGGYESQILRQKNLIWLLQAGLGGTTAAGVSTDGYKKVFSASEIRFATRIERSWTGKWLTEVDAGFTIPVKVQTTPNTQKSGTNLSATLGLGVGYRLNSALTSWLGYRYEQLRYGTQVIGSSGTEQIDSVDYTENAVRLGVSVRW